jgi:tetraacyldisaccharide 4'-kinase
VIERREQPPTHWILDDGFQHRFIRRDIDVVLLDADKPFGQLLPKGRFREPTESLGRAHAAVFTRSNMPKLPRVGDRSYLSLVAPSLKVGFSEMTFCPPRCVWLAEHLLAHEIHGGVYLVSGIAQPADFRRGAESLGFKILGVCTAADHESIDFEKVTELSRAHPGPILMTEKDWARCEPHVQAFLLPIFVLPMRASLPQELVDLISVTRSST